MTTERNLSWHDLSILGRVAEEKFAHIEEPETRQSAIYDFVGKYQQGYRVAVFNDRNQFLDDFESIEEAEDYINEHEPKNELWSIDLFEDNN